jgi:hypothetical protein
MMKATVAIGAKCEGVRDLVRAPVGQHLHMVHFKKWRAVVGEKRRWIGAGFAEALGIGQNLSSHPGIRLESDPVQPQDAALRFGYAKRRAEIG